MGGVRKKNKAHKMPQEYRIKEDDTYLVVQDQKIKYLMNLNTKGMGYQMIWNT
jgi:hypothetical protein